MINIFEIEKDGLPDMDKLVGRVAFIFDGAIISGWPLYNIHLKYPENNHPVYGMDCWEASEDVCKGVFAGVKKYVVFDVPIWEL